MHSLGHEYSFVNESQLQAAANLLSKETGINWNVNGKTITVSVETNAQTWEQGESLFRNKLRGITEQTGATHIAITGTMRKLTSANPVKINGGGGATVTATLNHPKEIALLAAKFLKTWEPTPTLSTEINKNILDSGADYLTKKTGFQWKTGDNQLSCDVIISIPQNQEDSWANGEILFRKQLKETTGLDDSNVSVLPTKRGMKEQTVHIISSISDNYILERLAQLNSPVQILRTPQGDVRSLTTISHRLCTVTGAYNIKELNQPNPERILPFPFITLSDRGLTIKLPKQLVEDRPIVDAVQNLTKKSATPIQENIFGREFVAQITIPLESVRSFIEDDLGIKGNLSSQEKFSLIDDMLAVNKQSEAPLNQESINILRRIH